MAKQRRVKTPRNFSQPYDTKLYKTCDVCEGKMFYRKGRMFNQSIYYIICNECGNYQQISKEEFSEKVREASQKSE